VDKDFWDRTSPWANLITTVIALIILFKAAWSRGLFFQEDFLIVHIFIGILGLCYLPLLLKKAKFRMNVLDWVFFCLGMAYTISIMGSANVSSAIGETLRVWTYILFYFILSRALISETLIKLFMNGYIVISTIISVIGLLTVPGIIQYDGSWAMGMLNSTMQYHNAFAGFLIAPMILSIFLWLNVFDKSRGSLYSIAFMLMSIGLAGSQSRGGYIIFSLVIIVFFITYRANRKGLVFLPVLNILAGMLIWGKFLSAATAQSIGAIFGWLVVSIIWALVVHFGGLMIGRLLHNKPGNLLKPLLIVALVGLIVAGIYVFIRSGSDVLTRIKSINIHDHALEERLTIYSDTLKMLIQRPLTGYGGGGWAAAYRGFQSYLYNSTETHSIFFKIVVETGLLGLITLIAIPIAITKMSKRTLRIVKKSKIAYKLSGYYWVTILAILGIVTHALVDFDLSEGALSLLLWGLLAMLRGLNLQAESIRNHDDYSENNHQNTKSKNKKNKVELQEKDWLTLFHSSRLPLGIISGLVSIILIVLPLLIFNEMAYGKRANILLSQKSYQTALDSYNKAQRSFPFQTTDWDGSAKASIQIALKNQDRGMAVEALADSKKAVDLNRYDPSVWNNRATILTQTGDEAGAYQALIKVKELAPLYSIVYYNLGSQGIYYVMNSAKAGDLKTAKDVASYISSLPEQITSKVDSLSPFYKRNWLDPQRLEVSPVLKLVAAEAKVLLGKVEGEKELTSLLSEPDPSTVKDAKIWLGAISLKTGDLGKQEFVRSANQDDLKNMQNISMAIGLIK